MRQVYKCDYCDECFARETEARNHEDKCGHNPKNKISNRTVFRLSMIFHSLPTIIACALYEVAANELEHLYQETKRADSNNCAFVIKEQQLKMLMAISEAQNVMRKHSGRNSCAYKDVEKEYPELPSGKC